MENKLSILLVEDDSSICTRYMDLIDDSDDMLLVGVTNNAFKAVEEIRDTLPDVIILDLELHLGSGSGLDVLFGMKDLELSQPPYVLVVTNNISSITYDSARSLGADYIWSKHQDNYSEKGIVGFLRLLKSVIQNRKSVSPSGNKTTQTPAIREKRLTRRIMSELNRVGVSPKAIGYKYLIDAILINSKEPTQNICCIIGKKYGKTESSVERAMQNAINRAWATAPIDDLLENYTASIRSSKGVPTLTEFIFYYSSKLKNEY